MTWQLVFVGVLKVLEPGRMWQLVIALCLSLAYFILFAQTVTAAQSHK